MNYLGFALRRGAPLPWYGLVAWSAFVHMTWQAALVGALSGAIGWFAVVGRRRPLVIVGLFSVALVAIAMSVAALTHQG